MSGQWKAGDVAIVSNAIAMRLPYDSAACPENHGHYGGDHWHLADGRWISDYSVAHTHARRLVVIDPEDRDQVAALCDALTGKRPMPVNERLDAFDRLVVNNTAMQEALRSLVGPPKPAEPTGLGAVVRDANGDEWVRADEIHPQGWVRRKLKESGYHTWSTWDELGTVEVLSEGWSE